MCHVPGWLAVLTRQGLERVVAMPTQLRPRTGRKSVGAPPAGLTLAERALLDRVSSDPSLLLRPEYKVLSEWITSMDSEQTRLRKREDECGAAPPQPRALGEHNQVPDTSARVPAKKSRIPASRKSMLPKPGGPVTMDSSAAAPAPSAAPEALARAPHAVGATAPPLQPAPSQPNQLPTPPEIGSRSAPGGPGDLDQLPQISRSEISSSPLLEATQPLAPSARLSSSHTPRPQPLQRHLSSIGDTPTLSSPPKSVHRSTRPGRESLASDGIQTPSLEGMHACMHVLTPHLSPLTSHLSPITDHHHPSPSSSPSPITDHPHPSPSKARLQP